MWFIQPVWKLLLRENILVIEIELAKFLRNSVVNRPRLILRVTGKV